MFIPWGWNRTHWTNPSPSKLSSCFPDSTSHSLHVLSYAADNKSDES